MINLKQKHNNTNVEDDDSCLFLKNVSVFGMRQSTIQEHLTTTDTDTHSHQPIKQFNNNINKI